MYFRKIPFALSYLIRTIAIGIAIHPYRVRQIQPVKSVR